MNKVLLATTLTLCCLSSTAQTVYNIEAVRPFQGEPPADEPVDKPIDEESDTKANVTNAESTTASDSSQAANNNETDVAQDTDVEEVPVDTGPGFAGEPTVVSAESLNEVGSSETVVVSGRIYQCRDGNRDVFVDEDNKSKFSDCSMIRDQQVMQVLKAPETASEQSVDYCTGMIRFRGNTYVFDDKNPCPIPADFFKMLTPIEAQPSYYLQNSAKP